MKNKVVLLAEEEKQESRVLWELVFPEDSGKFLDDYYRHKAGKNQILGIREQGELVSMLHLNPYEIRVGSACRQLHYIVAVATKAEYRHQGKMGDLLTAAFQKMYAEGEAFTYLMPAAEAIYEPFGFATVYRQSSLMVEKPDPGREEAVRCRECSREEYEKLAEFSETLLKQNAGVFTERSDGYYKKMARELEAMNGNILIFTEGEEWKGYCFSGYEGQAEVWEMAVEKGCDKAAAQAAAEYFAEKNRLPVTIKGFFAGRDLSGITDDQILYRPTIMVRIIHLEEMIRLVRTCREIAFEAVIKDPLIRENNGCFRFVFTKEGGKVFLVEEKEDTPCMSITGLGEFLFGLKRPEGFKKEEWLLPEPVYLNELV